VTAGNESEGKLRERLWNKKEKNLVNDRIKVIKKKRK
jgi:hypothetical protein